MASFKLRGLLEEIEYDDEFSDDEFAPQEKIHLDLQRGEDERPLWDSFINKPVSSGSSSELAESFMQTGVKVLKVITYLLTFSLVLGAGVLSKGIVMLMASQLEINKTIPVCKYGDGLINADINREYKAEISKEENVMWAWYLFFLFSVPEIFSFLRSLRLKFFKNVVSTRFCDFLVVSIFETLHTIGIGLFMFTVLPTIDAIQGVMLSSCVALVPGIFSLLARKGNERLFAVKLGFDVVAIVCQILGIVIWPIIQYFEGSDSNHDGNIFLATISLILISFGWWENYVDESSGFLSSLKDIKQRLKYSRYSVYVFVSLWKIMIMFVVMVLSIGTIHDNFDLVFNMDKVFTNHTIVISELRDRMFSEYSEESHPNPITPNPLLPLYVFLCAVATSYCCYIFGKFACKIHIQSFSFAFPVSLVSPTTIMALMIISGYRYEDPCDFDFMPVYLFWKFDNGDILHNFLSHNYSWMWIFWLLSQVWISIHIWNNNSERLASTEKLFVTPMYSSILVDQSIMFNRRRDEFKEYEKLEEENEEEDKNAHYENMPDTYTTKTSDSVTRIYACATMWHETSDEMKEMLKSIIRVDEDQCARRMAQQYLHIIDKDYYEFQTHIMFDDAFEVTQDTDGRDEHQVNQFVRDMVDSVEVAASYVHKTNVRIRAPKKIPTPYGGRLVYTLPGKTKIIVHLKDKDKIRHKKRWSQVMYMYYLLGFKLMDTNIPVERKEIMAENTYILALDGDIDFAPKAIAYLVDLMKKNHNLGAACGRIHPVGSGLLVWYQMFEYAVGHWMQKATEHMIGCVLCSPGCFSMFRGKALMDENVMAKYTTKSSQARHYVQFDQGEDRWLCTLLLQRGYRVEYSAAADSYTNAPEGFAEFYNQRRRWTPSTMANILDLLSDYKNIVKRNENISMIYICYQGMLMGGTILGPGTIFTMLIGAFTTAFVTLSTSTAFYINFVPIVLYCVGCIFMKSDNQIRFAYILSAIYALIMIIVLVGMVVTFADEGFNSPSSMFFLTTIIAFIITGILHPQEIMCLPAGAVYYLLVPSMYLLLQIYSCYNLNNVSWGTRELPTKKSKAELEAERKEAEQAAAKNKKNDNSLLSIFFSDKMQDHEGSLEFSLAGLFKCMCCIHKQPDDKVKVANALEAIQKKLEKMDSSNPAQLGRRKSSLRSKPGSSIVAGDYYSDEDTNSEQMADYEERDFLKNPFWIEDKALRRGEVDYLSSVEISFWESLIETYLRPLIKNKDSEKKAANELKDLRNMVVFTFTMLNAIFVVTVFLLQINQDKIHVNWFLGITCNITMKEDDEDMQINIAKTYLQLEPIGIVFLCFFAVLLVIQFIAMLFHRFATFSQILSTTQLFSGKNKNNEVDDLTKHGVNFVKELQALDAVNGDVEDEDKNKTKPASRRMTIHKIENNRRKEPAVTSLDVAFRKRLESMSEPGRRQSVQRDSILLNIRDSKKRRDTVSILMDRRMQVERKMSMAPSTSTSDRQSRNSRTTSLNEQV